MNREEAIYFANCLKNNYTVDLNDMEAFCDMAIKALEQEPTTKNDLAGDIMEFPKTFDEFAEDYGFKDKDEIYTNGSELIPIFRVKQWLKHISTTKNDLGVDCINRQAVIDLMVQKWGENFSGDSAMQESIDAIRIMPSVTPQEPILDKIRAEIETKYGQCSICEYDSDYGGRWYQVGDIADILQMFDKYKAETEET